MRVMIVDHQTLFRGMLEQLLGQYPSMSIVASVSGDRDLLALALQKKPDMILADIHTPGMDTADALMTWRAALPDARVMVLTSRPDAYTVANARKAGVHACLGKDIAPERLLMAIACVQDGLEVFVRETGSDPRFDAVDLAVLRLLAEQRSNAEIAHVLAFRIGSVKNRLTRMYRKTGTANRKALAEHALAQGIISQLP